MRLGRILAGLAPDGAGGARPRRPDGDPGLPRKARTGPDGEPILLADQNRGQMGPFAHPARPRRARPRRGARPQRGPYVLQAAIAACHARARDRRRHRLADDRRASFARSPSSAPRPVIELNRAVALSMAFGPQAGLDLVDQLLDEPALKNYHLLPGVQG